MGVLNLVHELMHSFGAKHDPEPSEKAECTPEDKVIKQIQILFIHHIIYYNGTFYFYLSISVRILILLFQWVNGRFLMSKYSNDGHKLNHMVLSPCTKG